MIIKSETTLMAYDGDIRNRTWVDWMKAHTSLLKPVHRYEGELILYNDSLDFKGIDSKSGRNYSIRIRKWDVLDIQYGFDRVFRKGEDRSLGFGFKPLKIRFRSGHSERDMYLITSFNRMKRSSNNEEWRRILNEWQNS